MAEGIKRIAKALYDRTNEEGKNEAEEFFKKLDLNGDRKISLAEFKTGVESWLSDDEFFKKLDSNSDGALYFGDVLVLFYHHKDAIAIHKCCECRRHLLDPYFICSKCLPNWPQAYYLCCTCFRAAKFKHDHPLTDFLHDEAARSQSFHQIRTQSEMEQLGEIARAHYQAASPDVQVLAKEFFNSMDSDKDGQVGLPEFLSFMRQKGYLQMRNPYFFKKLDKDGNGTLDFWEVMTLYYIVKSERPFCDGCAEFIPGVFFSCVECFKRNNPENTFTLCRPCYQSAAIKHNHNGRTLYLDNYSLLQATRAALGEAVGEPMKAQATSSSSQAISSSSQAVVLAGKQGKADIAFNALDAVVKIATLAASIANACTIL